MIMNSEKRTLSNSVLDQKVVIDQKPLLCGMLDSSISNPSSSPLPVSPETEKGNMWQKNQTSLADFILEGLFDDSFTHLFLFLLIMVIFLLAVSGNTLTILLICADPQLHTPMYFLLSQLSLMDLMHISTTIPKMAANYLTGKKSISFVSCAINTSSICLWVVLSVFS
jgi:hypothetical protein